SLKVLLACTALQCASRLLWRAECAPGSWCSSAVWPWRLFRHSGLACADLDCDRFKRGAARRVDGPGGPMGLSPPRGPRPVGPLGLGLLRRQLALAIDRS